MIQIFRQDQEGGHEKMAYACELVNGVKMVTEVIFDKSTSAVNMRLTGPSDSYLLYFHHALSIIMTLWWSIKMDITLLQYQDEPSKTFNVFYKLSKKSQGYLYCCFILNNEGSTWVATVFDYFC